MSKKVEKPNYRKRKTSICRNSGSILIALFCVSEANVQVRPELRTSSAESIRQQFFLLSVRITARNVFIVRGYCRACCAEQVADCSILRPAENISRYLYSFFQYGGWITEAQLERVGNQMVRVICFLGHIETKFQRLDTCWPFQWQ